MGVERDAKGLVCVLPFKDANVGNRWLPAVHGGVIGAFLEMTALLALLDQSQDDRIARPINFSTDYLRSAGPQQTHGRAEIVKLGRRIANVRVVAYQDEEAKPVAAGIGNFLL
ncbi:MAG: PaaI family thioesterase [Deltaproteobacteria bacterium]|nr:PaaI family thioesterase [Deltaproteobacteria bacterium]MBW2362147.1 PaaI family thioesterase [Deltaproteobacteria bacterium]